MSDYISRQAAIDALHTKFRDGFDEDKWWNSTHVLAAIEAIPPADVVPYSIDPDGTLTITVPKGTKVGRVLVEEEGTHCGGLYYAD